MFILAQISDLLYLFFLIYLSENIFKASKDFLFGMIFIFFVSKNILLYFYINKKKYSTLIFILLRILLFIFPIFYLLIICYQGNVKIYLIILFTLLLFNFLAIYRTLEFRIWKIILLLLYLFTSYWLVILIFLLIERML